MEFKNVFLLFSRLSGLQKEDSLKFRFLCETAYDYILAHLKQEASLDKCGSRLEFAAAALAYYRWILWSLTESGDDITVGEISVKPSSQKIEYALHICRQALGDIADVFDSDEFVFEGV